MMNNGNKAIKDGSSKPIVGPPKTKASNRIIVFNDELKLILNSISRTVSYTQNKKKHTIESKYVMPNTLGNLQSPANWAKRIYKPLLLLIKEQYKKEHKKEMKILNPHELRHSYGTYLYHNGIDIRTIQKIMGHASIEITSNLYIHDDIEALRKAMKLN